MDGKLVDNNSSNDLLFGGEEYDVDKLKVIKGELKGLLLLGIDIYGSDEERFDIMG